MSEDHQTRTVDGAAEFQRGSHCASQEVVSVYVGTPRHKTSRGDLHPNDPNHVDEPDTEEKDEP